MTTKKLSKKKAKKKNLDAKKSQKKKSKSHKKISNKSIEENFLNLKNYQEIDREFLDYSKNYQTVEWLKIKDGERVG